MTAEIRELDEERDSEQLCVHGNIPWSCDPCAREEYEYERGHHPEEFD